MLGIHKKALCTYPVCNGNLIHSLLTKFNECFNWKVQPFHRHIFHVSFLISRAGIFIKKKSRRSSNLCATGHSVYSSFFYTGSPVKQVTNHKKKKLTKNERKKRKSWLWLPGKFYHKRTLRNPSTSGCFSDIVISSLHYKVNLSTSWNKLECFCIVNVWCIKLY